MNTVDINTVTEKGNDPAYPTLIYEEKSGKPIAHRLGLTKREMFAMAAMQGILASADDAGQKSVAKRAVELADELLKQLQK